jgi:hypothetical protein
MKIKPAPSGARRALSAEYDHHSDRLLLELDNGVMVSLPRAAIGGVKEASSTSLMRINLHNLGTELEWPDLDFSFSIPEMLPELIGLGATVSQNARRAGSTTSEKKAAAVRANGASGGRPPSTPAGIWIAAFWKAAVDAFGAFTQLDSTRRVFGSHAVQAFRHGEQIVVTVDNIMMPPGGVGQYLREYTAESEPATAVADLRAHLAVAR